MKIIDNMEYKEFNDLVQAAYKQREWFVGIDYFPEQIEEVEEDDWTDDGKYSHSSAVYKCDQGNHFRVHSSRSGSYYSDYFYGEPTVTQVKPRVVIVSKVTWDEVK